MMRGLKQFVMEEDAAAATEYAIMIALLMMVVISTVMTLGSKTNSAFNNCASKL
jgi:pilus assembly protein Flp/PilA